MYRIQLNDFEGPMDLLLYFIRRDEVDIFDIPIARITDEFLAYLKVMQRVNLDVAGEFVYMAALLMGIKTKMLLPRQEVDEEGVPIDPRRELVARLLEYIRFKEASTHLERVHASRLERFTRGAASEVAGTIEAPHEVSYQVSVFGLISALKRVLQQVQEVAPVHEIKGEDYTIEQQEAYLLERLKAESRLSFVETCKGKSKTFIITTFLAILEMARQGLLLILIRETEVADFFLEAPTPESFESAVSAHGTDFNT